jgi:2-polyprenyl-3-methyl-5-hydroxy-6-metoxy-1,4-benzoquinol methylase
MTSIDYADTYDPDQDFDRHYTIATARRISERLAPGDRVLELGCATGLMSSVLADALVAGELTGVDRSPAFLDRARSRELPRCSFIEGDLDRLVDLGTEYDHIVATNVLHELADPVAFLSGCGEMLKADGLMHISLQNPSSIHRLAALELGMIDSLDEVSERGAQWGTRGLWSAEQLQELAADAGLATVSVEGVMFKPLPNALMADLPDQVIEGFVRVARHLPHLCAINYLVLCHG